MNGAQITAAIIAAISTLLGIFLKWFLDNKTNKKRADSRLKALTGSYYGHIQQDNCDDQCELALQIAKRNLVKGKLTVFYRQYGGYPATQQSMKISGEFHYEEILMLQYINENPSSKQVGCLLLEYTSDGKALKGKFIGFGPVTNSIEDCMGDISLEKVGSS